MLRPSPETRSSSNNSIKNSFTLSFDTWKTDRTVNDTQFQYQLNIGSAHKTRSPKYLAAAHQTSGRSAASKKATSDNPDVQKDCV